MNPLQPPSVRAFLHFKQTGEPVAVKTFNQVSQMRPLEVQMREFEVLNKVNHENIVRLLAVEEDVSRPLAGLAVVFREVDEAWASRFS